MNGTESNRNNVEQVDIFSGRYEIGLIRETATKNVEPKSGKDSFSLSFLTKLASWRMYLDQNTVERDRFSG